MSFFKDVQETPPVYVFDVNQKCKSDERPEKFNLVIGAYRTDDSENYVFQSIIEAEQRLSDAGKFIKLGLSNEEYLEYEPVVPRDWFTDDGVLNHEYLNQAGLAMLTENSRKILFVDKDPKELDEKLYSCQCLAGTGALSIGFQFLRLNYPNLKYFIGKPTWGNHMGVINDLTNDTPCEFYDYIDGSGNINIEEICNLIKSQTEKSVFLFQACCHNPTGIDPTYEQWEEICEAIKDNQENVIPFFDIAYQGMASGDLKEDGKALEIFYDNDLEFIVAQSFSKIFGFYGERIGNLHIKVNEPEIKEIVQANCNMRIRRGYSNPPTHGARLISIVLEDEELYQQWIDELKNVIYNRLNTARELLAEEFLKEPNPLTEHAEYVLNQKGMFSFFPMTSEQVDEICENDPPLYMLHWAGTNFGRISLPGVTSKNVAKVAACFKKVLKK